MQMSNLDEPSSIESAIDSYYQVPSKSTEYCHAFSAHNLPDFLCSAIPQQVTIAKLHEPGCRSSSPAVFTSGPILLACLYGFVVLLRRAKAALQPVPVIAEDEVGKKKSLLAWPIKGTPVTRKKIYKEAALCEVVAIKAHCGFIHEREEKLDIPMIPLPANVVTQSLRKSSLVMPDEKRVYKSLRPQQREMHFAYIHTQRCAGKEQIAKPLKVSKQPSLRASKPLSEPLCDVRAVFCRSFTEHSIEAKVPMEPVQRVSEVFFRRLVIRDRLTRRCKICLSLLGSQLHTLCVECKCIVHSHCSYQDACTDYCLACHLKKQAKEDLSKRTPRQSLSNKRVSWCDAEQEPCDDSRFDFEMLRIQEQPEVVAILQPRIVVSDKDQKKQLLQQKNVPLPKQDSVDNFPNPESYCVPGFLVNSPPLTTVTPEVSFQLIFIVCTKDQMQDFRQRLNKPVSIQSPPSVPCCLLHKQPEKKVATIQVFQIIMRVQARVRGWLQRIHYTKLIYQQGAVSQILRYDVSVRRLVFGNQQKLLAMYKHYVIYPSQTLNRIATLQLSKDFGILPKLCSREGINNAIDEVVSHRFVAGKEVMLSFEQFLKFLLVISMRHVKNMIFDEAVYKFDALLKVMDCSEGHSKVNSSRYTNRLARFVLFESDHLPDASVVKNIDISKVLQSRTSSRGSTNRAKKTLARRNAATHSRLQSVGSADQESVCDDYDEIEDGTAELCPSTRRKNVAAIPRTLAKKKISVRPKSPHSVADFV